MRFTEVDQSTNLPMSDQQPTDSVTPIYPSQALVVGYNIKNNIKNLSMYKLVNNESEGQKN